MRYNFKPAISPMKPCFAKGIRHTLFCPVMKVEFAGAAGFWKGVRKGFFCEKDLWGSVIVSNFHGIDSYYGKMRRTPTPWHKHQFRPARKLLNLRLSKNLNKRISIEMTMAGRVFDLSDFDVDEQKFSYDSRIDGQKIGGIELPQDKQKDFSGEIRPGAPKSSFKRDDIVMDIENSPQFIRVLNSYPNSGKIGFDIKISDAFLDGWAAAQDSRNYVNPYSAYAQRKSHNEWDMGRDFSIERKALGDLNYEDTVKYLYKKINSVSWIHQSEES